MIDIRSGGASPLPLNLQELAGAILQGAGKVPAGALGTVGPQVAAVREEPPPPSPLGPPELEPPGENRSYDEIMLVLSEWSQRISEATDETMRMSVENRLEVIRAATEQAIKKIEAYFAKCKREAEQEKANKILGWVKAVAGFVGAAVCCVGSIIATIGTGGAAAPTAAFAVMGLLSATAALGSQINQETGGNFEGYMVGDLTSVAAKIATEAGADPQTMMGVMVSVTVVMAVACVAGGHICAARATATGAQKVAEGVRLAQRISTGAQIAQGVTAGAASVGQGAMQIELGKIQEELANLLADGKMLDAAVAFLRQAAQFDLGMIKELFQQDARRRDTVSEIISEQGQTASVMLNAIGGRGAAA